MLVLLPSAQPRIYTKHRKKSSVYLKQAAIQVTIQFRLQQSSDNAAQNKKVKGTLNPHQGIKLWFVLRSDCVNILRYLYSCIVFKIAISMSV
jgi:hypothetical protein